MKTLIKMESEINLMKKEAQGYKVYILGNCCYRCNHKWIQRDSEKPTICPHCKSPYWDKPKKRLTKGRKKDAK